MTRRPVATPPVNATASTPGCVTGALVGPGVAHRRKKSDVARGARDVVIDALRDRLADIARLEYPEIARAFFDAVSQLVEDASARVGTHPRPRSTIRGLARRIDCTIHIVVARARDIRQFALGSRLDVGETRTLCRIDVTSADEQSGFPLCS